MCLHKLPSFMYIPMYQVQGGKTYTTVVCMPVQETVVSLGWLSLADWGRKAFIKNIKMQKHLHHMQPWIGIKLVSYYVLSSYVPRLLYLPSNINAC